MDRSEWYISNFIPMDSKNFEFRDIDFAIGFVFKNKKERFQKSKKLNHVRSIDPWKFLKRDFPLNA